MLVFQIVEPDWELYLRETAGMILKAQNNETLLKVGFFNLKNETSIISNFQVRERLYEVLSRCIPSNIIFSVFDIFKLPSIYFPQN